MATQTEDSTRGSTATLIGSIQRALRLVDLVASASRPLSPKQLASSLGLSLGTTYNIIRTLVHEGYLAQEPDGIILGPGHPVLSGGPDDGVVLSQVRQGLRDITSELGATAYLSRYDDGEVTIVDIADLPQAPRTELWVGISRSAHATALGKQILSELPVNERRDYLHRHPMEELTQHTIRDPHLLLAELERPAPARLDRQEYAIGLTCIAVPVRAPGTIASLAISMPAEKVDDLHAVVRHLKAAAGTLSLVYGTEALASGFTI
ncbi:MAG TPA: IclR family transcriptional regulator C-terminal domain-containing protein [Lacisediminihabitans sp.]|nr:IclR family transcriptional regulator C-terminal domain-containing protein [Lacisediminihabitans sp.]HXD62077.1 IclR family transcriptional regulator C-terminal domain-containing protein [Lacisediminihabitans sp.]